MMQPTPIGKEVLTGTASEADKWTGEALPLELLDKLSIPIFEWDTAGNQLHLNHSAKELGNLLGYGNNQPGLIKALVKDLILPAYLSQVEHEDFGEPDNPIHRSNVIQGHLTTTDNQLIEVNATALLTPRNITESEKVWLIINKYSKPGESINETLAADLAQKKFWGYVRDFTGFLRHEIGGEHQMIQFLMMKLANTLEDNLKGKQRVALINQTIAETGRLMEAITDLAKGMVMLETGSPLVEIRRMFQLEHIHPRGELVDIITKAQFRFPKDQKLNFRERRPAGVVATPAILAHKSLFDLALGNIVTNAMKYSPNGAAVDISLIYNQNNTCSIVIRDHGYGISEEHLQLIFNKGHRVPNGHKIDGQGYGLFLAMNAIRILGGNIDVKSKEGKGSRFVVTLPIQAPKYETQTMNVVSADEV